ncbi:uncharacterized protein An11g08780 [Aspergillus niger]|uniref:Contig An11c0300, genomic contig n=2 Tax=Aspergillus niger TaxID=5061 RepID=A2QXF6_ASPNC|nr:uncharacterized protein An11g08780 [Aspergillus niger]CAK97011.1 unnamed protein product [Aspergillus niger]
MSHMRPFGILPQNKTPDYEVRLLLEPAEILTPSIQLTNDVQSTFNMQPSATKESIEFFDTPTKEIFEGRLERQRPTLTHANRHGFNNEPTGDSREFKAQVEWGYANKVLSMASKKKLDGFLADELDFPSADRIRQMLSTEAPNKFRHWKIHDWGTYALQRSIIYGPILVDRYSGSWDNKPINLEVWYMVNPSASRTDYIVEVSCKTNNRASALFKQRRLVDELKSKGWLVDEDLKKTEAILDAYAV